MIKLFAIVLFGLFPFACFAQQEFVPENGKGRVVIVISGAAGPGPIDYIAKDLSTQCYYTILFDGRRFPGGDAGAQLKEIIARTQQSPHALPGKVAVMGFSMGGGYALTSATKMSDLVSSVVLYYPMTRYVRNLVGLGSEIKVPTLILAGVDDTLAGCCYIQNARKIAEGARKGDGPALLELVEYPNAFHDFVFKKGQYYREADTADSFRRTLDHLRKNFEQ